MFLDNDKPKENKENTEVYKEKIINSNEIDQLECNHILLKINVNDATDDEKFSVYKFKLKKFWGNCSCLLIRYILIIADISV